MNLKRPDPDQNLPRSWEISDGVKGLIWERHQTLFGQFMEKLMRPFVDIVFSMKKRYRSIRESYGYLTGPLLFGLPFLVFYRQYLKAYERRLEAGKIRYRYKAPEYLRIPPEGIKDYPPWNEEVIAPLRQPEKLSTFRLGVEHGSRMCPPPINEEFLSCLPPVPDLKYCNESKPEDLRKIETTDERRLKSKSQISEK